MTAISFHVEGTPAPTRGPRAPLTEWQSKNTPEVLPRHIRRSIAEGQGGCWLWTRSRSRDGYGWTSLDDKTYQAHRLVFRLLRGEPDAGQVLDHLCRVRHCVNPDHLEPVSPRENLARSPLTPTGMGDTCIKGHPLSKWHGQRRCVTCKAAYTEAHRQGDEWESRRPWAAQ
ncbi:MULTISPECIES: HNH endonuclease signature motif containing protein [unclassified Microbacterium]|uniref:HNH endonuclease signature motif containing protein n=1 Tax=unclassified Microbacterium TaxID=2609290 RepID=UPI00386690D5